MDFFREVDTDVAAGKYDEAIAGVRKNSSQYGEKSSVLLNLDLGALHHYAGNNDSSTAYLLNAEKEIDELFTKSISTEVMSFVLNDNLLPYEGEDFEKVMVNMFLALNFAEKGLPDDALVEARKVDLKLREYARQYEDKNAYREDAFIRYLAGALYESSGEVNDAFISYRTSYETYGVYLENYGTATPKFLLDDLVRTARELGFDDEAEKYIGLGGQDYEPVRKPQGSILVIVYAGKGPIKVEERPTVSIADDDGVLHTFQVALPKFVPRMTAPRDYVVTARSDSASTGGTAVLAQDITAIAKKCLEDRLALIYLKSGGRALLKFLAAEKAKSGIKDSKGSKLGNFLGSLGVDIAVRLTEKADVRTWRTLPAEIHILRLNVPDGSYALQVESSDGGFSVGNLKSDVTSGRTSIVIVDDLR